MHLPPFMLRLYFYDQTHVCMFFSVSTPMVIWCQIIVPFGAFQVAWCQRIQARGTGFNPWVRETPWRRKWQPPPVSLPGKSPGQRSLEGYSPWSCKNWTGLLTKQGMVTFNGFSCLGTSQGKPNHVFFLL